MGGHRPPLLRARRRRRPYHAEDSPRPGDAPRARAGGVPAPAPPAGAAVIRVRPGHSIQAAVAAATRGDHIVVYRGASHEASTPCPTAPTRRCAVVVTKDDVKLIGRPQKTK